MTTKCAIMSIVGLACFTTASVVSATPTKKRTRPAAERHKSSDEPASAPAPAAPLPVTLRTAESKTKCAACHVPGEWHRVTFNHDKTGFPLRDSHTRTECRSCHAGEFKTPIARTCAGCHRDPHVGQFGQLCVSCHDESSWQPSFDTDAHRGTAFPLSGAHALIPCQECHQQMRDRVFARTPTMCSGCHRKDYLATGATTIDHVAASLSDNCQECHSTQRFKPAALPAHEACFALKQSPHSGIACGQCHTQLSTVSVSGTCHTDNAACSNCHTHECAKTDTIHSQVPGYQCRDQRCYSCHRITRAAR